MFEIQIKIENFKTKFPKNIFFQKLSVQNRRQAGTCGSTGRPGKVKLSHPFFVCVLKVLTFVLSI
jgi:hypothetical protein